MGVGGNYRGDRGLGDREEGREGGRGFAEEEKRRERAGRGGGRTHLFACLSHFTTDHASLSRRNTIFKVVCKVLLSGRGPPYSLAIPVPYILTLLYAPRTSSTLRQQYCSIDCHVETVHSIYWCTLLLLVYQVHYCIADPALRPVCSNSGKRHTVISRALRSPTAFHLPV